MWNFLRHACAQIDSSSGGLAGINGTKNYFYHNSHNYNKRRLEKRIQLLVKKKVVHLQACEIK